MTDHKDPRYWREQYWNVDAPTIEPSVPPAIRRRRAWRALNIAAFVVCCLAFGFAMAMIWAGAL